MTVMTTGRLERWVDWVLRSRAFIEERNESRELDFCDELEVVAPLRLQHETGECPSLRGRIERVNDPAWERILAIRGQNLYYERHPEARRRQRRWNTVEEKRRARYIQAQSRFQMLSPMSLESVGAAVCHWCLEQHPRKRMHRVSAPYHWLCPMCHKLYKAQQAWIDCDEAGAPCP